ncbi:carbohydrate ABC transporter permease [Kineosporia sp. NBRC 101731]|uniref:carbohydrate ABC transporter permease n=1 Tax=Kineosporia sp. NBRC 101731 TaxID=3032199 RepID=UPI0024A5DC06|nr:carbohydrate ABC transporter permease [Kineosporia sp. NBRC 101731]GLY33123.1 sugar ABC transporter permease [Kineosporia sp. NBRC 101731]
MTAVIADPEPEAPRKPLRTKVVESNNQLFRASPLNYLVLVVTFFLSVFPLYWMLVMASRTNDEIVQIPPVLTPGGNLGKNFTSLFDNPDVMFAQALLNSFIVAGSITVVVVIFSSLAGFAFAKLRFRGSGVLLGLVVLTMMVPIQLGTVPLYMMMDWLGIQGTLLTVILPYLASGFGVFLMRQYASQAVPDELIEAARVDGASTIRIFWSVVLPALRPAAAILGLFTFMTYWNDFLWPYVALSPENPTVQVALSRLSSGYYTDQSLVMAGTLMATLPLLVVVVLFGRQLISGIMDGAVKS